MNDIVNAITTVGFPIVACLLLGWYVKYSTDKSDQRIEDLRKEHKEEVQKMTEALNNNTMALQRLIDRMDKEEE